MTSSDLVALYLDHVALYDDAGPTIRSVLEINPDAYEIAAALDEERTVGNVRGPLHGVPVLVKDNIDTADAMQTAAGSLALAGYFAPRDATVAARLRGPGRSYWAGPTSPSGPTSAPPSPRAAGPRAAGRA